MIKDERMKLIYGKVREGVTVCDVGTDHAIIPIELLLSGKAERCVLTDISAPSLEKGVKNAGNAGVGGKISAYCANGTLGVPLDGQMDFIIAGMGGELISQILDQDERLRNPGYGFVLQPMSKAEELRRYLAENGFLVKNETKVESGGRVYAVICCSYDGAVRTISEKELFLGYGFDAKRSLDRIYAEKVLASFRVRLKGLESAETRDESEINLLINQIKMIESLLK